MEGRAKRVCNACGECKTGEVFPFAFCEFCGMSPSWHHGRCTARTGKQKGSAETAHALPQASTSCTESVLYSFSNSSREQLWHSDTGCDSESHGTSEEGTRARRAWDDAVSLVKTCSKGFPSATETGLDMGPDFMGIYLANSRIAKTCETGNLHGCIQRGTCSKVRMRTWRLMHVLNRH